MIRRAKSILYMKLLQCLKGGVSFGEGSEIRWGSIQGGHKSSRLSVGSFSILKGSINQCGPNSRFVLGSGSFLGGGTVVLCRESVEIGSNVLIAQRCYITDTDAHSMIYQERKNDVYNSLRGEKDWTNVISDGVTIGDGAWIGPSVIILKGVSIGEGSIIGAGSVVTKNIPPHVVASGVPAKVIRKVGK